MDNLQQTNSLDWRLSPDLNEEQLQVVTAPDGPMLVIAGAGSGKTRTLTYRIAWLVDNGIDPGQILLMTFTNRAARDMLSRIENLLHREIRSVWGGTFHHLGNKILRLYGANIGIDPDFTILDRDDSKRLIKNCINELKAENQAHRFPAPGVLMSIFSFARNTMRPLHDILEENYPEHFRVADTIESVRDLYTFKKWEAMTLDFDDLLCMWVKLMDDCEEVKQLLCSRFQYILVDEYQDTNAIQDALVQRLGQHHKNICVVGDDSQSIYSFRGALFENIMQFRKRYSGTNTYKLETNYRSTPEIVELANVNIAHNSRRLEKHLHSVKENSKKPYLVSCRDNRMQARFLAEYIHSLFRSGYRPDDIAILYRSHWHSMDIQLEFQTQGILFDVRGGQRFFEQAHIKDILAYLRVIRNPADETAWLRILRHIEGVGEKYSQRVWNSLSQGNDPWSEMEKVASGKILPSKKQQGFNNLVKALKQAADKKSPAQMIETVTEKFYTEYLLTSYSNAKSRREDINGTIQFAGQYDDLNTFLADVILVGTETENKPPGLNDAGQEEEAVILSTIHQAKGLEWPIVFIPWLAEGKFPVDFGNNDIDVEEERRIFHVAVTRAQDYLYLTFPKTAYTKRGSNSALIPSRFVTELDKELMIPLLLEFDGSATRAGSGSTSQNSCAYNYENCGDDSSNHNPDWEKHREISSLTNEVQYDYDCW